MTRTGRQDAASASGFLVVASGNGRASLTWDDVNAIQTQIPLIERAVPYMHQAVQLVSEDQNWNAQVVGTTPDYYRLRGLTLAAGHSFNASESGKVVVLGETTAKQLYGAGKQPIGETVRIKNMPFEIIGVLAHQGMSPQGQDLDDVALVPIGVYASHIAYDDLKSQFGGVVLIAARLAEDTERVKTAVRTLLRDRHHLAAGVDDDFVIREAPAVR
jgi:putative ABC transport system permease protein